MPSRLADHCVCVLPPIECYWLVNMPVLWTIAGGWVRTLVLFLAICGPKYTELSLPVRECPYFATPFSDWRCLVAFQRHSRSSREVVRNRAKILLFLSRQISGRKGPPKFLTEFYKSGSPSNMWQSLVKIGQETSEIRRRKKDLNISRKTMACPYYCKGGHNKNTNWLMQ